MMNQLYDFRIKVCTWSVRFSALVYRTNCVILIKAEFCSYLTPHYPTCMCKSNVETMKIHFVLLFFSFGYSLGYAETTSDLKMLELEKKLSEFEKITKMLSQKLEITDLKLQQSEEENRIIRRELKLLTSNLQKEDNMMQDAASKQQLTTFRKEKPYTESKYHMLHKLNQLDSSQFWVLNLPHMFYFP